MRKPSLSTWLGLPLLLLCAALVAADTAPRAQFTGTLNHSPSKQTYSLTVPVTAKVGEQMVKVAAYDLPLVFPEGLDPTTLEDLQGVSVNISGHLFGEPRQLLVVDINREGSLGTTRARPEKKGTPKKDAFGVEIKEEK